jgi:hypothetical protein
VSLAKSAKKSGAASQMPRGKRTLPQALAQIKPTTISAFAVGDRVAHQQFGDGTITAIEGPKLSIAFDIEGNKQIIDSYVKRHKKVVLTVAHHPPHLPRNLSVP